MRRQTFPGLQQGLPTSSSHKQDSAFNPAVVQHIQCNAMSKPRATCTSKRLKATGRRDDKAVIPAPGRHKEEAPTWHEEVGRGKESKGGGAGA